MSGQETPPAAPEAAEDASTAGGKGKAGGKARRRRKRADTETPPVLPSPAIVENSRQTGRPRFYQTPEAFEAKVDEYVEHCRAESLPLTITGLCLFLGFADVCSLHDYGKRPDFAHVVKRARMVVESGYEARVATAKTGGAVAGGIFVLKNVAPDRWKDRTEVEYRGLIARLDMRRLPEELVARLADGESPASVFAPYLDAERLALPPGAPDGQDSQPDGG